jgi:hypothetical protein
VTWLVPAGSGFISAEAGVRAFEALDAEPGVASDVPVARQSRMVMRFMPLSYGSISGRRRADRRTAFKIDEGRKGIKKTG